MKRIKTSELEGIREEKAKYQQGKCALCDIDLKTVRACLDHDHKTGFIRDVLCLNCNGIEGKIFNLCRRAKRDMTEAGYLMRIMEYWGTHSVRADVFGGNGLLIHPSHKTPEEKRLARNKKARDRRRMA